MAKATYELLTSDSQAVLLVDDVDALDALGAHRVLTKQDAALGQVDVRPS